MPRLTLPAGEAYLARLMDFVIRAAEDAKFGAERIKAIELATEESLVNIIQHAYPEKEGMLTIDCRMDPESHFTVEIIDRGIPFDGLDFPDPDLTTDLDSRQMGGLGLYLIKKMTDDLRYRREEDRNILTLVFDTREPEDENGGNQSDT